MALTAPMTRIRRRDGHPRRARSVLLLCLAVAPLAPANADAQAGREQGRAVAPAASVQGGARGWFGFSFLVTREARRGRPLPEVVSIQSVVAGSPADRGGLRPGDVLVRVGADDATGERLQRRAERVRAGDTLRLAVRRGGNIRQLALIAAARPNGLRAISGNGGRFFLLDSLQTQAQIVLDSIRANVLHVRAQVRETGPGSEVELIVRDAAGEVRRLRFRPEDANALRRVRESLARQQRSAPTRIVIEDAESARQDVQRALRDVEAIRIQRGQELERMAARRRAQATGPGVSVAPAPAPGYGISIATASFGVAGAELAPMAPQMRPYFGVEDGLLVIRVGPGTPAARAGLREGDVVVSAGGRAVKSVTDIARAISGARGEGLALAVVRERKQLTLRIPGP